MAILLNAEAVVTRKILELFPTYQVNNYHLQIYSIFLKLYILGQQATASFFITLLRKQEHTTLHWLIVKYRVVLIILLIRHIEGTSRSGTLVHL